MNQDSRAVVLGDPVPWFQAQSLGGGRVDLHVSAGRWVVLAFMGSLAEAREQERLARLAKYAETSSEDHLNIFVVLATPPENATQLQALGGPVLRFVGDYDAAVASHYNAQHALRTVVLDPMLRAVANIPCDPAADHDRIFDQFLSNLPSVENSAGVPLVAPVLMVPRVFDFPLCDHLVALFDKIGGTDSGFLVDHGGRPASITDHRKKSRRDLVIVAPELRRLIRERIVKRLLPAVELYFQFSATHMDRYVVACYDSADNGHFFRHRDNLTAGVEHRRFAVSINLNSNYEGCDLMFPEFGRRTYRAPAGGAMVFSCGALHEVTPITKGKRYAFLPFLYGDSDLKKSLENNALLQKIGVEYRAGEHSLFPQQPE